MLCAREDPQRFPWEAAAPQGPGCLIFTGFIFQKYPIFQLFFKENEVSFPLLSWEHISHAANMFSFVFWQLRCEAEQEHSRALFPGWVLVPWRQRQISGKLWGFAQAENLIPKPVQAPGTSWYVGMLLMRVHVESLWLEGLKTFLFLTKHFEFLSCFAVKFNGDGGGQPEVGLMILEIFFPTNPSASG